MAALQVPVIVVAGSYLGTLSHTLTTVAALKDRDIQIAGVVVDESEDSPVPLNETMHTLGRFLPGLNLVFLTRDADQASIFTALRNIIGE